VRAKKHIDKISYKQIYLQYYHNITFQWHNIRPSRNHLQTNRKLPQ